MTEPVKEKVKRPPTPKRPKPKVAVKVEKPKVKAKRPAKAKPVDPRILELKEKQKVLDAEIKQVKKLMLDEKRSVSLAEKKVTIQLKGLMQQLLSVKRGVTKYNVDLTKASTFKHVKVATVNMHKHIDNMRDGINAIHALQLGVVSLTTGEIDEDDEL